MTPLIPIANKIWQDKYSFPGEVAPEDTYRRVAADLASVEEKPEEWEEEFYKVMASHEFMPAGRIVAGAGTSRNVTLFNCYVMGTVPDSMDGIFEMLKEAALTMQQGGGIGYDFSTIRPKGAPVVGVGSDASGPLSFMDVWDSMCRTIMSAGTRRGAMMATLRCDHPDILDFIEAKRDPSRLRMFNVSVLCTDAFMAAVANDHEWQLVFNGKVHSTISARVLWNKIMQATYDVAEPGVIFIDRINDDNNLKRVETIAATNPCGEQPLPPYGACLLGSINLAKFVHAPFSPASGVEVERLERTVHTAIRMLDNSIDVSRFPLSQQEGEAKFKRRIGLGVTGLADMLAMIGKTYGSDHAVGYVDTIMKLITTAAYKASEQLAHEKGPAPVFQTTALSNPRGSFAQRHGFPEIRRNSHLISIAPTGTISLFMNNVSSGCEPIFATEYERKVLNPDGTHDVELVQDYAVAEYNRIYQDPDPYTGKDIPLPGYFVTAQDLPPEAHVKMQAVLQKWTDTSVSKTINLPEDISFEDFKDVYTMAYEMGCKGCTTYRPNDVTGSVLSVAPSVSSKKDDEPIDTLLPEPDRLNLDTNPKRDEALDGVTYKRRYNDTALYITINDIWDEDLDRYKPFEIFINSKDMQHYAWVTGLTRMISAVFRKAEDPSFIVEEFKSVFDPAGGVWDKGKFIPSIISLLGDVIEEHLKRLDVEVSISLVPKGIVDSQLTVMDHGEITTRTIKGNQCPKCHQFTLYYQSGCATCTNCGYSKCE